jgi:cobyrinic acid a,c-diamide synthase
MSVEEIPRVVIAALKGGAGKTFLTVGLIAALRRRGFRVSAFKKGPDYIDAGWLGMAAGNDCHNLDPFLFSREMILHSFQKHSRSAQIAVIEGNRGLYDGMDSMGSYSAAELAKTLNSPIILIMDVTKVTRTAAAMALGCKVLDPDLDIRGVILNRVGGARHERILRESIERSAGIPVIGSVGKLPMKTFPQRHLGLLPLHEHPNAVNFVHEAAAVVEKGIDLDQVVLLSRRARPLPLAPMEPLPQARKYPDEGPVRIGFLKDSAFQFYYPENLEALEAQGASLIRINSLDSNELPELDALYIGGGFPETHADKLAQNTRFNESLRDAVSNGLPVYAECGGLMFLSRNLQVDENRYPMVGVLPIDTVLNRKPQGHGYVRVEVDGENPFYPKGTILTGHEFHYSYVRDTEKSSVISVFKVHRGHGIDGERDGLYVGNVLATYLHVHAYGQPIWAKALMDRARSYRNEKEQRSKTGKTQGEART